MTDEQQAAFLISQAAAAMIEAMGAAAENAQRAVLGQSMAYDEAAFQNIIARHGLGHNDALSVLGIGR